jgi:hypothetical protein
MVGVGLVVNSYHSVRRNVCSLQRLLPQRLLQLRRIVRGAASSRKRDDGHSVTPPPHIHLLASSVKSLTHTPPLLQRCVRVFACTHTPQHIVPGRIRGTTLLPPPISPSIPSTSTPFRPRVRLTKFHTGFLYEINGANRYAPSQQYHGAPPPQGGPMANPNVIYKNA